MRYITQLIGLFIAVCFGSAMDIAAIQQEVPREIGERVTKELHSSVNMTMKICSGKLCSAHNFLPSYCTVNCRL